VRVIKGDRLDDNTPQTPGMYRQAAINHARVGAQKIWAGTVSIQPNAKTGAHHHGELESVIYVVKGKARMRWGEQLEFVAISRQKKAPARGRGFRKAWCDSLEVALDAEASLPGVP